MHDDSAHRNRARPLSLVLFLLILASPARAQIVALPRADSTTGDFFGTAVAIDGERVLVGATAVNSCGINSGAAYIYEKLPDRDEWELAARLVPSDCLEGRFFGRSVSLSGGVAVVASSHEFFSLESPNAVYVFERDSTGSWRETARLTGGSERVEGAFGTSVSVEGDRILVTTSGDPDHGRFGGAAYVFERIAGAWEQTARFTAGGGVREGIFGTSGALSGDVAAVAASTYFRNRPGSIYLFERSAEGEWRETGRIGGIEDFFISLDASDGRVIAGETKANGDGAALIIDNETRATQKLKPAEPYRSGAFGSSVAIDGNDALVVGYDEQLGLDFNIDRVVFVFKYDRGEWRQHFVIDVGELAFGASLDVDGGLAVVGSASESVPGAAYVVRVP